MYSLVPLTNLAAHSAALAAEQADLETLRQDPDADEELLLLADDEEDALRARIARHATEVVGHLLARHRAEAFSDPSEEAHTSSPTAAIVEVRAGTGGEEAALFVLDLLNAYTRLSSRRGWQVRELSRSEATRGGLREVILRVHGTSVVHSLSAEAGVHRVQRVPATETQGRVHTSTASVAVLSDDSGAGRSVVVKDGDVKIDVYRASGAGGQHVNKTESAVRVTHIPTGLVAISQDDRSQHRNRATAMESLVARLAAKQAAEVREKRTAERRAQLGATAGERSDRIRTYNFPQRRVTDHRIVPDQALLQLLPSAKDVLGNKSVSLAGVLDGGPELDHIIEAVNRAKDLDLLREMLMLAEKDVAVEGIQKKRGEKRRATA